MNILLGWLGVNALAAAVAAWIGWRNRHDPVEPDWRERLGR